MASKKKTQKKPSFIKKMSAEEQESYFVSTKNPLELRRHLLESSKKAVLALQNFQRLQLIRQQKLKELVNLRQSIKELIYLNRKLNDKLPKFDIGLLNEYRKVSKEAKEVVKAAAPIAKPEKKPEVRLQREKTDMEKLEDSLASIEKKLQSLQN